MSLQNQIDILALGLFNANNKKQVDGFGIYEPVLAPRLVKKFESNEKPAKYVLPNDKEYSTLPGYVQELGENGSTTSPTFYFLETFFLTGNPGENLDIETIEKYYNNELDPEGEAEEVTKYNNVKTALDNLTIEHITAKIDFAAKQSRSLSFIIDKYGKIINAKTESYDRLNNARLILNDGDLDGEGDGFAVIPEK